jgi:hypothetical protein
MKKDKGEWCLMPVIPALGWQSLKEKEILKYF